MLNPPQENISSSPITIHENYIFRQNYDALVMESRSNSNNNNSTTSVADQEPSSFNPYKDPGLNNLKHRQSHVSLISNSLIVGEFANKSTATTAVNNENASGDEIEVASLHPINAHRSLSQHTTPTLKVFHSNEDDITSDIANFTFTTETGNNEYEYEHESNGNGNPVDDPQSETISKLISPIIRESRVVNSQNGSVTPSIMSDHESTLDSSFNNGSMLDTDISTKPIDFGFELESADNDDDSDTFFKHKKHFFILSSAGKPIYSMHGSDDILTVYAGVIQTIVSFFQYGSNGESESLKSIVAGSRDGNKVRFLFLNKSPIILMASSTLGESDIQLNQQLDFLYNFLLTTLSKPHIDRVFQRRENFDLRKLLGKADIACLDSICTDLANFNNPGLIIGGLECLKLRKTTRTKIDNILLSNKSENLLYGLLVAPNGRLVSVLRPRKHTLHTSDLQLLFSMIFNTDTFRSTSKDGTAPAELTPNEDFWVPVCLPKFNSNGFLYAFIQFIDLKDRNLMKLYDLNMDVLKENDNGVNPDSTKMTVILISAFKDSFFEMRKISNKIIKNLKLNRQIYRELYKSIVGTQGFDGSTGLPSGKISPIDIPAPLVKHFIFKSKKHTQFVYSRFQSNNNSLETVPRLEQSEDPKTKGQMMMIYSYLYSRMILNHRNNPQLQDNEQPQLVHQQLQQQINNTKKKQLSLLDSNNFINMIKWKSGSDAIVGLLISTPSYEVYLLNNGGVVDKSLLIKSCRSIVRWCKKNEDRLFISSGAVF